MNWKDYVRRKMHIISKPKFLQVLEFCRRWTTEYAIAKHMKLSQPTINQNYLSYLVNLGFLEKKKSYVFTRNRTGKEAKYHYRTKEIPTTPQVPLSIAMIARDVDMGISIRDKLEEYNKTYRYALIKKIRKYDIFTEEDKVAWYPETEIIEYDKPTEEDYSIKPLVFNKTPEYDKFLQEKDDDNYDELDFIKESL